MGETFLDRHGIKSGIKLNDVIEDFKYVYKGQTIKAGDLVNYINGIAGKVDYGESVDTQLSTETNAGYTISAVALDNNRVFIAHSYGSSYYLYGVIVTIDGASITYGTDTKIDGTSHSGYAISACLLPNGNVFIAHSSSGSYYLYGIVVSISGTTITKGTDTSIVGASYTGYTISTCLLPNGNVFIAHSHTSTNYRLAAIVCTISGTTISKGTDTSIDVTTNYAGYTISTCLLPNGNVFIAHSYGSSYYLYGIVCSISGTTISKGTDTALSTEVYAGDGISTCTLNNGNVFIAHCHSETQSWLNGIVCSVNGTTITKGTDTTIVGYSYYGKNPNAVLLLNGNIFIVCRGQPGNLYGVLVGISSTTITGGTDTVLNSNAYTGYAISPVLLNNGTVFIAHSKSSSYYLNAQVFGIDYENNIPTNNIVITEYEQQVTPAIEPPFNAVALSSGVGAPEFVEGEVVKEGNVFPTTWATTSRTQATASDGTTITASSSYDEESTPDLVTDGDENTEWIANDVSGDLTIKLTEAKKITKMKVKGFTGVTLSSLIIQGSNNETDWIDLHSSSDSYSSLTEIELSNTDYYLYYKINVTGSGNYPRISEWQTSEYIVKEQIPSTEHNEQVKIARVYKILTKTDDILAKLYKEGKATVKASSQSSSSDGISSMFDGDETTGHCAASASSSYAKVEFEEAQKILKMKLKFLMGGETANFTSMTVQGSNNNSEWTDLCVINEQLDKLTEVTLENTDYYKYYQLYCTKPGNSSTWIYEWQVSEYETEVVG